MNPIRTNTPSHKKLPSMEDFDRLLTETQRQARKAGMKKSDITEAIKKVRARTASHGIQCHYRPVS